MKINTITPKKSLNKAFLKQKPLRNEIDLFKKNLIVLFTKINEIEREENQKNHIRDFLRDTYYKDTNEINTKDVKDLVIHLGKTDKDKVGVIIEAKRPSNKNEMLSSDKNNVKALHELILYYLDERNNAGNNELKQLIITNVYEWYIFDANYFDKLFYRNTKIKKLFETYTNDKKDTPFFYEEVSKIIQQIDEEIPCTYFDIRSYEKVLKDDNKENDNNLIALFKILSPYHLLKTPFANDSNSLNDKFYKELLHIIGLEEAKEGGKNIIRRKKENRNSGSLLENTISAIETEDTLHRIPDITLFGDNKQDRVYNVALELCITWINRILFIKLLEGQLVNYHKGDKQFRFLNNETIHDFDELFKLFHKVLAVNLNDRVPAIISKYCKIPYLNSSLFEISELEEQVIKINSLDNSEQLELINNTILKDVRKKTDKLTNLDYLFKFLDSYDFANEGKTEIQEENKGIINASVLGKVFEKINGYKDGSIFTPGFITMYMCRKSVRLAVIQKFKDKYGWNVEKFEDLKNYLADRKSSKDILEFNALINSLKMCDPAVGSGHFLVSLLNEIIAIKYELGLLADENGIRITDYEITIENDELILTDQNDDIFEYTINSGKPTTKEAQRVQKTLFREKQTIIENCLFGVDINPNSVKICRLRLWIELLKSAYYKEETNYSELETLPNIDINIKCGNSLISRFALDSDLKKALKSIKYNIEQYRDFVRAYKNEKNRDVKRGIQKIIDSIKADFKTNIDDPFKSKISKARGEVDNVLTELNTKQQWGEKIPKELKDKLNKVTENLAKLEKEKGEIILNVIYKNAFEWRFEFPEVLNNDGDFVGFDMVIGNPPYMRVQEIEKSQPLQKLQYEEIYRVAKGSYDLANLFFELAVNIAKPTSNNAYIFPHKFLNADSGFEFRNYLLEGKYIDQFAHFGANMIFENADTYTCIAFFSKKENEGFYFQKFNFKSNYQELIFNENRFQFLSYDSLKNASQLYGVNNWILFDNEFGFKAFEKIYQQKSSIEKKIDIFVGLQTSKDEIYVLDLLEVKEYTFLVRVPLDSQVFEVEKEFFKPFLMGKGVQRYEKLFPKKVVFFPYQSNQNSILVTDDLLKSDFPLTYHYIQTYEKEFKKRESGKAGKMKHWYAYIYPKNLSKFEQPKLSSMEICSSHPNVTLDFDNFYHPTTVYSWLKKESTTEDYRYFLAIANSNLIWWFLKNTGDTLQGDARRFKTNYLYPFPLPLDVSEDQQKPLINLVNQIIETKQQNLNTTDLEKQIDSLVYKLYDLTEDEIKIIENN